jgi:PAS domain S-box-containing protein
MGAKVASKRHTSSPPITLGNRKRECSPNSSERQQECSDQTLAPSFAQALLTNVVGLVSGLGLVLLITMVWQNTVSTEEAAKQEIGETLNRATERLRILLRAAEMVAESAERIVHTNDATGSTLRPALESLLPAFEQRPELSYLGVVLPEAGEYGTLERKITGDIHLRLHPGTRKTDTMVRSLGLTPKGFVAQETYPTHGYDPRERPFYKAALEGPAQGTWMLAYPWIIHTAPGSSRPDEDALWGISYVKALRDSSGKVKGVLDTDFDLPALNRFLTSLGSEFRTHLHVIELGPAPRLIGDAGVDRTPQPLPVEFAALTGLSGNNAVIQRMALGGERRWVAARRLELAGGVTWLAVASRAAPVIEAPLRHQLWQVLGMGLAIVLALAMVSVRVARRFSGPLAALKDRVASIEHELPALPEPSTPPIATKGFRETQLLGDALDRMAIAVREQVLSKEEHAASLALKVAIFDSTSTTIFSLESKRNVIEWNAAAERLFGMPREQVVDRIIDDVVVAPDGSADWAMILETPRTASFPLLGANGPFEAEIRLVTFTREGERIHTVLLTDISEHKRIEQRLLQERDYADTVINSLPGIFYHIDEQFRLVRWNRNFERASGYSAEELIGADPMIFLPDGRKSVVSKRLQEILDKGETSFEADYLLKDGRRIPYLFTGVRFEYNGLWGFVGTGTDITDRKDAQARLLAFNADLEQRVAHRTAELQAANEELDAFCHSVAHDLRTPLRSIAGYAAILAQEHADRLDSEGLDFLGRVQAAT